MTTVITSGTAYVVMIGSFPHTVDRKTMTCACGKECDAKRILAEYLVSGHRCSVCDALTTRHPLLPGAWICPNDKTHYWQARRELNRRRWELHEPAKVQGQDGVAQTAIVPPKVSTVPESRKPAT